MTIDEAKRYLQGRIELIDEYYPQVEDYREALDITIKALERQTCDDAISREAVDKHLTDLLSGYLYEEERNRLEELTVFIWELPSVQPIRPRGKWIATENEEMNIVGFYCSSCDLPMETEERTAFCPYCGARMESEEGE